MLQKSAGQVGTPTRKRKGLYWSLLELLARASCRHYKASQVFCDSLKQVFAALAFAERKNLRVGSSVYTVIYLFI